MIARRVLQIAHDHPAWTLGGAELLARGLARALAERPEARARLLATWISIQRAPAAGFDAVDGDIAAFAGVHDRFLMSRLDSDRWREELGALLRSERPDVVHLHGVDRTGVETIAIARAAAPGAAIVLTLHDFQILCAHDGLMVRTEDGGLCDAPAPDRCARCFPAIAPARFALRERYLAAFLDLVDRFVAPSRFLRDRFVAAGLDPARIVVLPNPALGAAEDVAPDPPADAPPRRFGFFGNVAAHKGALVLLEAARRLAERGVDVSIRLHGGLRRGDDGFRTAFERALAAARPVADHAGPYAPEALPALMAEVDWVVTPSLWWENAPLVIAEARRRRRPVICSGVGGMAETVRHDVDGLHVRRGDAEHLAATIAAAGRDRGLRDRLATAAPEPPSLPAYAEAHLALYGAILDRRAA